MKITNKILILIISSMIGVLSLSVDSVIAGGFNFDGLNDQGFGSQNNVDGSYFETNNRGQTSLKGAEDTLVKCKTPDECDFDEFLNTFERIVKLLLEIAIAFSTIVFCYAGFLLMTSGDNPGNRQRAKNMIWTAVIGFFIAAAAWLIVEVFINTLEGDKDVIQVEQFKF